MILSDLKSKDVALKYRGEIDTILWEFISFCDNYNLFVEGMDVFDRITSMLESDIITKKDIKSYKQSICEDLEYKDMGKGRYESYRPNLLHTIQ